MTATEIGIYPCRGAVESLSLQSIPGGVADAMPLPHRKQSVTTPHIERDALYSEFAPLVSRLLRQYGDDCETRQDLIGEIYCRFAAFVAAYDPSRGIPLRPYLVRQLTFSAYNFARGHRRGRRREASLDAMPAGAAAKFSADPTSRWDHDLANRRVRESLPDAMASLPGRQRQVIIWRYYENRSFEEIAAALRIKPATARSLLRHGLTNLRRWAARNRLEWDPE